MFNTKLTTTNAMRRLRLCILVFAHLFWRTSLLSASFSALAGGATVTTLLTHGVMPRVATSGSSLILVILAAGMMPLLLFQGVHPVTLSISPRIALESCALNAGSPNGFLLGLVWAGGIPPLPLLPIPPLPHYLCLGSVVAGNLCPLQGTLWCTDVDLTIGQSFGADDM